MTTNVRETKAGRWIRWLYAALLIVIGLSLGAGGVALITAGGSLYYLITGIVVTMSGVLILRRNCRGVWLYGAMLVATMAWSLWEVRFEIWGLVPRLASGLSPRLEPRAFLRHSIANDA
ncbi:MAG: hypothetical protein ACJ8EL_08405 [Rhizomicrobium sp.]